MKHAWLDRAMEKLRCESSDFSNFYHLLAQMGAHAGKYLHPEKSKWPADLVDFSLRNVTIQRIVAIN